MGSYTVIDKIEAKLDPESDTYRAVFSNLNLKNVLVADTYIKQFEKLLAGFSELFQKIHHTKIKLKNWCVIRKKND